MIYLKFNPTNIFLFFFFLFSPSVIVGQTILQVTQTQTDGNVANLNVGGGFVLANNRGVNDFVNNGLLIGALTPSTNRNKFATQIDELLSGANLNNNNNNQQLAILIDSTPADGPLSFCFTCPICDLTYLDVLLEKNVTSIVYRRGGILLGDCYFRTPIPNLFSELSLRYLLEDEYDELRTFATSTENNYFISYPNIETKKDWDTVSDDPLNGEEALTIIDARFGFFLGRGSILILCTLFVIFFWWLVIWRQVINGEAKYKKVVWVMLFAHILFLGAAIFMIVAGSYRLTLGRKSYNNLGEYDYDHEIAFRFGNLWLTVQSMTYSAWCYYYIIILKGGINNRKIYGFLYVLFILQVHGSIAATAFAAFTWFSGEIIAAGTITFVIVVQLIIYVIVYRNDQRMVKLKGAAAKQRNLTPVLVLFFTGVVGLACGALQVGFDQCSTVDGISDCIRRSQIGGIVFSIIFLLVELSFLYLSFWIATNRIKMRVFKRSKSTRGSTRGSRSTQSNSNQTGPQDEMSLDDMSNSGENKSSITQ